MLGSNRISGLQKRQQALQRRLHGLLAHRFPVTRKALDTRERFDDISCAPPPRDPHRANRFTRRATTGSGNAAGRHRIVCSGGLQGTTRHGQHSLFADRTGCLRAVETGNGNAEQLLLGLIGLGDETCLEPVRTARHGGDALGNPTAGTGLGCGHLAVLLQQQFAALAAEGKQGFVHGLSMSIIDFVGVSLLAIEFCFQLNREQARSHID